MTLQEGKRWEKRLLLLLAALLAGAGGLGLEVVVTNLAGLTIGYGRAAPVGIGVYIGGWALGAWIAGTHTRRERTCWWFAGALLLVIGFAAPHLLVATAASGSGGIVAWLVTIGVLLAAALPQGFLLPLIGRHWSLGQRGDLGYLFGANLLGAALGAWWFAEWIPTYYGRSVAAAAAGACAGLVGLSGALLARRAAAVPVELERSERSTGPWLSLWQAGCLLAVVTGWVGTLEWFAVRLGLLWFGGMQATLGNVLVASMIALAAGAAILPRVLPRSRRGLALLAYLCVASSASLFFLPTMLGEAETQPLLVRALILIGPALFPFGAWVPLLHRQLEGESAQRLGRLLGFEALGVTIGLPLSHLVLLPLFGMDGTLAAWGALGCFLGASQLERWRVPTAIVGAALVLFSVVRFAGGSPALESPPLANPQLERLEFHEDEHFAVAVVQDGVLGERTLMTDGFRAAASGRDYAYMRALGHLPLLLHSVPRSVGVLAFGTGTTAGSVSLHPEVHALEILELSSTVTREAHQFEEVNRGVLDDPRVRLSLGDGRHTLAARRDSYDVLTMEPLLPDSPFGVYLYTEEFYERAKSSLKSGGLLCQWVPPHALEPVVFEAVLSAFTSAFDWSSIWVFGTQVILLGSETAPVPDPSRFPTDEGELQRELAVLGFDTLDGLLARFVALGDAFPEPARPLTDLDPWVIYRPRRPGSLAIGDLPRNLARLRESAQPVPVEWWLGLAAEAEARFRGVALVREAREAFAVESARALGVDLRDANLAEDSEGLLERATRLAPNDPELLRLEMEIDFVTSLQQAKRLLAADRSQEGSAAAAALLARAAALRPERADVHAYLSVALERLGSDRAVEAMGRALELCPRLLETRVGEQLRAFER